MPKSPPAAPATGNSRGEQGDIAPHRRKRVRRSAKKRQPKQFDWRPRVQLCAIGCAVPEVGLEPTQPCGYWILNPARLPFRHSGSCRPARECDRSRQRRNIVQRPRLVQSLIPRVYNRCNQPHWPAGLGRSCGREQQAFSACQLWKTCCETVDGCRQTSLAGVDRFWVMSMGSVVIDHRPTVCRPSVDGFSTAGVTS